MSLSLWAVPGIGTVGPGADLAAVIEAAARADGRPLRDGDVVVVASKIVAKAEGRAVSFDRRDEVIDAESVRLVAARTLPDGRVTRVVESAAGPVMAAAGVDASDVEDGTVLLLPVDADASAAAVRERLGRLGVWVGVIVSDTSGRPWRAGVADFALGASGVVCLDDRRGQLDTTGRPMTVTVRAVADELAAAADLVKGKAAGTPVAVVRGLPAELLDPCGQAERTARGLVRTGVSDWFRTGHVEAVWQALGVDPQPPSIDAAAESLADRVARAVAVALTHRPSVVHPGLAAVRAEQHPGADLTSVEVQLSGPPFALGLVVERLLTAAWADDLAAEASAAEGHQECAITLSPTTR